MTMSKGCCVYAQATQWGQIAGIAAHSLAALSPAALSLAALPFAALPFAACRACHAHTVCHIGTMHSLLRWTRAPYPPSVAYHILISTVAAPFYDPNVAEIVNSCIIGSHRSFTTQMTGMHCSNMLLSLLSAWTVK